MADVSARAPIFPRGSAVLDYWLVHAEGLTVQPLGARVEEVVVAARVGRAEALIVRSRMTRRRRSIPAESIASVAPSAGELLLDVRAGSIPQRRAPHLSPERVAAVRAASAATVAWLRPRAARAGRTTSQQLQRAAVHTGRGAAWLAPRLAAGARTGAAVAARLTLAAAVIVARAARRSARELERAAASAIERGRASLEERRARRSSAPDE